MELTLNNGDSFKLPENSKVTVNNGIAIVEPLNYEPKDGDFLYTPDDDGWIYIFKAIKDEDYHYCYVASKEDFITTSNVDGRYIGIIKTFTLATPEQKQILIDALHAKGKEWDAVNKKIVDLKPVPKAGDCVRFKSIGYLIYCQISNIEDGTKIHVCNDIRIVDGKIHDDAIGGYYCSLLISKDLTIITPEEYQSEFAKLGYKYDFETKTVSKLKWEPKIGEECYMLFPFPNEGKTNNCIKFYTRTVRHIKYNGSFLHQEAFKNGLVFKTMDKLNEAMNQIKELLKTVDHE